MPRHTASPTTIALTVIAGTVLIGIDMTIVNIALPHLSAETGAPLPVIQWAVTGYTLALAAAIPITAWAVSRFGARRLFLASLGVFTVGSALVASSWDAESLIAFRVVQGLGGGFVLPAAMTLVLGSTPQERRGRVMAILGLPIFVGPVLGPVLGGVLIDALSWRWMFLINVPLGLLAVVLGVRNLPRVPAGPTPAVDVRGLLLLPPAMVLLVLGTTVANSDITAMLLLLGTGLLLAASFVWHALRAHAPLLDVRLLGKSRTATGTTILFLFTSGYSASMILIPLYWQVARGESATTTGLYLAPAGLAAALSVQLSGRLIDKVPPLRVIGSGLGIATAAMTALTLLLGPDSPAWLLVSLWTVIAFGAGLTIMPSTTVATRSLEGPEIPSGSTIMSLISQVAGAICIAAVSVLLTTQLMSGIPGVAGDGLDALTGLTSDQLTALAQPIAVALRAAFWLPVGLIASAAVVAVLTLRRVPAPPPGPSQDAPVATGVEGSGA